jgi:hypothetical protein
VDPQSVGAYCREIETYLTRKNDGHLIRVVGPSFELVSGWAKSGIPLKVAFRGIDRHFERYYRQGPRRRPVKIDFCEADVLDAFDAWRRAVGLPGVALDEGEASIAVKAPEVRRGPSLAAHLERVLLRLTDARAKGSLGVRADALLDRVAVELDSARQSTRGLRGEARARVIDRLAKLDVELLDVAREDLPCQEQDVLARQAAEELAAFRDRMRPDAFRTACRAAADRLLRERLGLPTVSF